MTFQTPQASGYVVVDGDTANLIIINAINVNIGIWDIGLHHVQVYTGDSAVVAFRGFCWNSRDNIVFVKKKSIQNS